MWVLLAMLVALGLFAAAANLIASSRNSGTEEGNALTPAAPPTTDSASPACNNCAAEGTGCYAERILRHTQNQAAQYFEDEELDAYKGRAADAYNEAETSEFAEVLDTLRQEEVADWLHALTVRGIELPVALRDEAILLLG
ncbi:MAG: hypothetical protein J6M53_07045 [Bacteroidaceae bacterium]|nr:hypothetical protein [Bacteroidaceae bacterium]